MLPCMASRFRLKELLETHDPPISQSELARLSGVSFMTVNGIVNNRTKQVSLNTLDALSRPLGCKPGDLIERVPEETKRRKGK
ncbi:MAG: Cro/C1-type DNA-binding domain [Gemmatimonadetes bacterium]|nr:Cro/C1-type DNA-binding domain [Gemmatimonadota bacterium]